MVTEASKASLTFVTLYNSRIRALRAPLDMPPWMPPLLLLNRNLGGPP